MAALSNENAQTPLTDNESAAGHAVRETEHLVNANADELERKNTAAPSSERIAAGAREVGERAAAKYHEGMKNAESSM